MDEVGLFGFCCVLKKKIARCHARDVAHSRWVQEVGQTVGANGWGWRLSVNGQLILQVVEDVVGGGGQTASGGEG